MSETIGFDIERIENKRVAYSLLSKPFLILTGNSGTGKTLIASRRAEKTFIRRKVWRSVFRRG
jgi:hypothetical protein